MDDAKAISTVTPPEPWVIALDRADDDIAAGRVTPWPIVRARLLAKITEAEVLQPAQKA